MSWRRHTPYMGRLRDGRRISVGRVELISGCMFSGKTTLLLKRIDACAPGQWIAFKHTLDYRYVRGAVVSHNWRQAPAVPVCGAWGILDHVPPHCRLVAIDEAHFFDDALVDACLELSQRGFDVVMTGLDPDSWGRPIPIIQALRDVVTHERRLTAVCARCGGLGERTQRLVPFVNGNLVGGPESFEPRCVSCWRPPPETVEDPKTV